MSRLPPLLLIQLKRFKYSVSGQSRLGKQKINTYVEYPLDDLDMTEFLLPSMRSQLASPAQAHYRLIGVVNHSGTADFGHYYAYCKDEYNAQDNWFEYNDSSVSAVREGEVVNKNAYVLLYRRSDLGSEIYSTISSMKIAAGKKSTTLEDVKESFMKLESEKKLGRERNDGVDCDRKQGVEAADNGEESSNAKGDKEPTKASKASKEEDSRGKRHLSKQERALLKKQMHEERRAERRSQRR